MPSCVVDFRTLVLTKHATTQERPQMNIEKAKALAAALGVRENRVHPTDFGRGRSGWSVEIVGETGQLMSTLFIIPRKDGSYQVKQEIPIWILTKLKEVGFPLVVDKESKPEPPAGLKIADTPAKPKAKGKPKGKPVAAATEPAEAESVEEEQATHRTIGARIKMMRDEAQSLQFSLDEEPDDEDEDEMDAEYRESDTETAHGLVDVLKEVADPSAKVAAIVVEHRSRTDWSGLDRVKDMADEITRIREAYTASGVTDKEFEGTLEELEGWTCEF